MWDFSCHQNLWNSSWHTSHWQSSQYSHPDCWWCHLDTKYEDYWHFPPGWINRRGKSINLTEQVDWSIKFGVLQRINTPDGYITPLYIISGLQYLTNIPYTDTVQDKLPHFILTGDDDWTPAILVHPNDDCFDTTKNLNGETSIHLFDEFGNYYKFSTSWIAIHMILTSRCYPENTKLCAEAHHPP